MSSRIEACGDKSLPDGWSMRRIDSLLSSTIRDFGSFSMTNLIEFVDDGVPFIKSESVANGHINFDNIAYITERVHRLLTKSVVQKGDVLFTKIGAIGRVAVYDGRLGVCNSNAATAKIQISANQADTSFFAYQLGSERVKREFEKTIISTPPRINLGEINSMKIELPPLPQQRKIARILTTLDNVIEKTEALIGKYQAIKQGLMHDLFTRGVDATGKLRPPQSEAPELYKQSELGWIPKEWEVRTIATSAIEVIDGDRGANYPAQDEFTNEGYCLFLSATNVTRNGFVFESMQFISREKDEVLGTGKLRRHDIVVTTRGTVGNIAHYDDNVPYSNIRLNSGMLILRNNDHALSSKYFYHSYKNHLFRRDYERVVSGSAQPQLPSRDVKKFRVVKPIPAEQALISQRAETVETYLHSELELLKKLKLQKTGLMQDLLTGKVRVNVEVGMENDEVEGGISGRKNAE